MRNSTRSILTAGSLAPSGENAQPWRFRVKEPDGGLEVTILLDKEADKSVYNWGNRAVYLAIGACAENMCIEATRHGLSSAVYIFPEGENGPVCWIRFEMKDGTVDRLTSAIENRGTNRRPYENTPLTQPEKLALMSTALSEHIRVDILEVAEQKEACARIGSVNEEIMLGNKAIHNFFFEHVNWSKKADDAKRSGFLIDTLELPAPAKFGFKVVSSWSRATFLNRFLKFNKVVAKQNAAVYEKAAAFGVISYDAESPTHAFNAGRAFERVWLEAALRGLQLQPLMGTIFLALAAKNDPTCGLSEPEKALTKKALEDLAAVANLGKRIPYALFRVGRGKPPRAKSIRKPVEMLLEKEI